MRQVSVEFCATSKMSVFKLHVHVTIFCKKRIKRLKALKMDLKTLYGSKIWMQEIFFQEKCFREAFLGENERGNANFSRFDIRQTALGILGAQADQSYGSVSPAARNAGFLQKEY